MLRKLTHNDTQIYVVFNIKFNKMEEDKNLEQNLDKSNEKLHISDVSFSIGDFCKVKVDGNIVDAEVTNINYDKRTYNCRVNGTIIYINNIPITRFHRY
jgi:hypothetical protein